MREAGDKPWEWHNTTGAGASCGSHAHIRFDGADERDEDHVAGMTVAWNTAVELTPFLAPFWCADWQGGFRDDVGYWASPQTTRFSQSTMARKLEAEADRSYSSVTLNPPSGSKPHTIELRLNEGHPSFSLVGLTFLRRVITKACRKGWSPKLAGGRRGALEGLYQAIYEGGDLVGSMKEAGPFRFEEGRGIPGSDVLEYDSAWDVLEKVFAVNGIDRGAYDDHVKKLVQAAGSGEAHEARNPEGLAADAGEPGVAADGGSVVLSGSALGPQNNTGAVWRTLDDDFSWDVGPEVDPR
jgi:hypothetical protein